jgi:hypothetical protein
MLKEIAIVTITVSNLTQVETAWQEHFDYQVADRGTVSAELSEYWQAGATEGQDYIIMQPANDAPVYIRFVADDAVADYTAMASTGWNATELLITDPDDLAARIRGKGFDVIGEPKDLWPAPDAPRALQAVGPGRELLYLTRNNQLAGSLGLDASRPAVERAFIMVLGGHSMQAFNDFYSGKLGLDELEANPFKITMISRANDLDMENNYLLAVVATAPGYLIELDEMPASVKARETQPGHLPPGVAIVGFKAVNLAGGLSWYSETRNLDEFPYDGRETGILQGPAGELIEVIEPEPGDWGLWPGQD